MTAIDLVAIAPTEKSRIRDAWCALELSSRPSYFLSWGWVETWLDALPPSAGITLYVARRAGAPIAAFFLGARTQWRHRVLPSRTLHLNKTGDDAYDEICIEYNNVLHDGESPPIAEIIARLPGGWDELYLPALDADGALATRLVTDGALATHRIADHAGLRVRVERRVLAPMVDLDKVRASGDYLKLLGSNTRSQIRRTRKLYGARGTLVFDVASSPGQALAFLDELVALHRRTWAERGQPGAFVPFVLAFHQRLIERRFAAGEIQMIRVRAGDTTIGYLYNLVWQGAVSFYQSGLAYEADGKLKPGLVCHALAIEHNARAGHRYYDFLVGESRYKQSLSTDARALVWLRIQQPRLRFVLENAARAVRDRVRARWAARMVQDELPPS
jgi:CelD/BcsL family acetyltransferase involved in cellulose biosynthesis